MLPATVQQTFYGTVLIECFPMAVSTTKRDRRTLVWKGMQKAREPCQGHADRSSVLDLDPHAVPVERH